MNFFKKAQEFAASSGNDETPEAKPEGGFGSFLSGASSMMKTGEGGADQETAAPVALPGGRHAPSNSELLESTQLLFGAAQGQNVENTKLAGAAEDLLGGLATYGKLDQGQYATYIDQAEGYLHKYAGEDTPPPRTAAREGAAPEPESVSDAPAEKVISEVPASRSDDSESPTETGNAAPARRVPRTSADEEDSFAQRD